MRLFCRVMAWGILGLWLVSASAAVGDTKLQAVRDALSRIIPGESPDAVEPAPIPGFYEVTYGSDIFYISDDTHYVFQGDLFDLDTQTNLTEDKRSEFRLAQMDDIDGKTAIVFGPAKDKVRYKVRVFTDMDCTYCRKLHSQIAEYNERGIEIDYLAYPRTGVNTPSYFKAVSVWCSDDRKAALTTAKAGQPIPHKSCDNPVLHHMSVANRIGVSGTPTLVFSDGSVLPGYASPEQLINYLDARFKQ